MTIRTSYLVQRMIPAAGALAAITVALLLSACGETPKMGTSGSGSGGAPASASQPAPAPMDAASAPKQ